MKQLLWFSLLLLVSCSGDRKALKIKGSDTEVNLAVELAEQFYAKDQNFSIAVSGGGSGLGIASLYNGQADIANSSRPLSDDEIQMFKDKGIELKTHVFAEDATAIIVNPTIKIDEIDKETLAKIFDGTIKNWREISDTDLPINIYGRQSNSGTHSFVQKKLGIKFSQNAKEMNGNAQIMEGIKADPSGIGYVGAGYLLNNEGKMQVKPLKIKGDQNNVAISPLDYEAIKKGEYFFQRPLYQFIPVTSWNKAKAFIEFEENPLGKDIIRKSGYYITEN